MPPALHLSWDETQRRTGRTIIAKGSSRRAGTGDARGSPLAEEVEAASPLGWERYAGPEGRIFGLSRFGASAPAKTLAEKLGFTGENIARVALEMLGR